MTGTNLIYTIAEHIRNVTKDYKLLAEYQPDKKVSVYEFDIPHGDCETDSYIPYVIISPKLIDLVDRDSIITVAFLIATYSGVKGNDWRDMLSISERIRQFILTTPILAEKYLWRNNFTWQPVSTEQPSPFILGYIESDYTIATPEYIPNYPKVRF